MLDFKGNNENMQMRGLCVVRVTVRGSGGGGGKTAPGNARAWGGGRGYWLHVHDGISSTISFCWVAAIIFFLFFIAQNVTYKVINLS